MMTRARHVAILAALSLCGCAQHINSPSDDWLVARVLERRYDDGGYTVLDPETTMVHLFSEGPHQALQREHLRAELAQAGLETPSLVDWFFIKNRKPARLSIQSEPERGYVLDHDGGFRRYFDSADGKGWERWYSENPKAHGYTHVSLPAYDRTSGLVLIYIGTQRHWEDGAGFLKMFRLENGKMREVWSTSLWIS